MSTAQDIFDAIQNVHDQESFIQNLLVNTMNWDIDPATLDIEDTAYEYTAAELNSPLLDEKCNGRALQLTFQSEIPWGVFLIEFDHEEPFVQARGLTMPLRQLLNALVPKRRRDSNLPAWDRENLLFICTHNYKHFRFAFFNAPSENVKTAPLKIFGWNNGDTAVRTLCERNLPYLEWDNSQDWAEAFDIERVTKDFYLEYADVFKVMENAIGENNDISGDDLRMFTQLLFNRLMFLRFIERKGWLTFGDTPDYLANLYATGGLNGESFYRSRLVPLFFEGLAVEGQQESDVIGKVPFLNGGLFDKSTLDAQVKDIPDDYFKPILDQRGLFYRYNFTISESTPLNIEVAVDPEMLGKVFEELVTGRHESGSYYTPRPVVAFMCREALKGYLNDKTSASAEAIEKLIDDHEVADGLTEGQAEEILWYLDTVKACDPACGSGAYLLGLMQELIAIRRALQSEKLKADPTFLYKLKRDIISRSLYGVDIDPFATNVAKLRLWLSLSVESDNPQPLPNLDFKIETGDSLLGPCGEALGPMFNIELQARAGEIVDMKLQHENAHGDEKARIATELDEKIAYLRDLAGSVRQDKAIVWPADFPEVFCPKDKAETTFKGKLPFMADGKQKTFKVTTYEPGGFDIVLANPPYVRKEKIPARAKPILRQNFYEAITGRSDLYCSFYARATQMLAPGGMHVFICSSSWLDAGYGVALQAFMLRHCQLNAIYDSIYEKQFSTANVNTIVSVFQKARGATNGNCKFVLMRGPFVEAVSNDSLRTEVHVAQNVLWSSNLVDGKYVGDKWGGKYLRAPDTYKRIFGQKDDRFARLSEVATVGGYIHDNNTGQPYPIAKVLWSLRDASAILVSTETPTLREIGVKPRGNSRDYAPILFARTFGTRHLIPVVENGVLGKEFYKVTPRDGYSVTVIAAQLNSTLGILQREILGIKGLGGGAIKFAAADVAQFQILAELPEDAIEAAFRRLAERTVMDIDTELLQEDRRDLDSIIFDYIGLDESDRKQVYDDTLKLVLARKNKARQSG